MFLLIEYVVYFIATLKLQHAFERLLLDLVFPIIRQLQSSLPRTFLRYPCIKHSRFVDIIWSVLGNCFQGDDKSSQPQARSMEAGILLYFGTAKTNLTYVYEFLAPSWNPKLRLVKHKNNSIPSLIWIWLFYQTISKPLTAQIIASHHAANKSNSLPISNLSAGSPGSGLCSTGHFIYQASKIEGNNCKCRNSNGGWNGCGLLAWKIQNFGHDKRYTGS